MTQQPTPTPTPASGALPEAARTAEPRGLPRFLVAVLALAATLVALSQLQQVGSVVAPVFLALNLVITAYPLNRWLVRRGAPAWLASIAAGLAVLVVLLLILGGLIYSVIALVDEMPRYTAQFTDLYNETLKIAARYGLDQTMLLDKLKGVDPSSLMGVLTGVLTNVSSIASLVILVVTTLIFLVMDSMGFEQRLALIGDDHPEVADALMGFAEGIRKYWLVSSAFGLVVAVLNYGVLLWVGVPLAMVWATFSFLTNYIPNVGFFVGVLPPALLAFAEKGWQSAVVVLAAYCVVNFIIQTIIQPRVAGDAVGLTPTMSFLSLLLWGLVLGPMGALIALPLSLLAKAFLVDIDPNSRWANALISSKKPRPDVVKAASTPKSA